MATKSSIDVDKTSVGAGKVVSDPTYNLISILYHALKGADLYNEYIEDAEAAGDNDLRDFFIEVREQDSLRAQRARQLLAGRAQLESATEWQAANEPPSGVPGVEDAAE